MSLRPTNDEASALSEGVDVESAAAYVERAWALESFGRSEAAIAEVQRGLAEYPVDAELNGSLAWLECFFGDRDRAELAARQAIEARPDDWRGLNILVELAVARGELTDAELIARDMVGLLPNWSGSHLALAYALAQPRPERRAARASRSASVAAHVAEGVALAPEDVDSLRRGAILLHRTGKSDEAAELLNRALSLDPDSEALRLLTLEITPKSMSESVRLLTGVLAQNPQQRAVARTLSDTVWTRTQMLAAMTTFFLAGMMIFAYLIFGDTIMLSHRSRMNLAYLFISLPVAWLLLFVAIGRALPPRYLRRLWAPVWWVWLALPIAAVTGLLTLLVAFAFAARSQPTSMSMNGPYVGGLTSLIGVIALGSLVAELAIVFARYRSEQRNRLFGDGTAGVDADGIAAAREETRSALWGLLRTALAVALVLLPVYAADIASRPEAAGGLPAVAIALGAPPVVRVLLCAGREGSLAHRPAWPAIVGALALAVGACVATGSLAAVHLSQLDPPPTPWELKMREQQRQIEESLAALDGIIDLDVEQLDADRQRAMHELHEKLDGLTDQSPTAP